MTFDVVVTKTTATDFNDALALRRLQQKGGVIHYLDLHTRYYDQAALYRQGLGHDGDVQARWKVAPSTKHLPNP